MMTCLDIFHYDLSILRQGKIAVTDCNDDSQTNPKS